jgi:hypothetical protein
MFQKTMQHGMPLAASPCLQRFQHSNLQQQVGVCDVAAAAAELLTGFCRK